MNDGLKKIERTLIILFLILAFVAIIGVIILIKSSHKQGDTADSGPSSEEATDGYDWEQGLSDSTLWLPENCDLYTQIPDFTIQDEDGNSHSIREFEGKPTIVIFWASWCSDCGEEMPNLNDYIREAENYGDVQFILVDKLDGEKETKDSALQYLEAQGITIGTYYDEGLVAYDTLGMHNIPTSFFLDSDGIIRTWCPKQITETAVFEAYLQNLLKGSDNATLEFLQDCMMDDKGGIHSTYDEKAENADASDILSESQGAMLEYAYEANNQALFNQTLAYIDTTLLSAKGLTAWTNSNGNPSAVNALIDDFRIYRSLYNANEKWSGYDSDLAKYESAIKTYGINDISTADNFNYVDFYDTDSKEYAKRFTLCYADLAAMKILSGKDVSLQTAYDNAVKIVTEGQISESFPLYYSYYDYDKKEYNDVELNSAEAMVTLLHLSEAGMLPESSLNWIRTQMENSGVKARYHVNGKVVEGYNYDSTAVYAIIAMIANNEGDTALRSQALKKMEKMRINDTRLCYNGAFGNTDGTGISSFDQIMPLLAYQKIENEIDE